MLTHAVASSIPEATDTPQPRSGGVGQVPAEPVRGLVQGHAGVTELLHLRTQLRWEHAVRELGTVPFFPVAPLPVRAGERVMQQQLQMLTGGVPALRERPFQRGILGGVDEDDKQVTPRERRGREPSQPLPEPQQLVLDLGRVLVDQVDEREDSPRVAPMAF